MLEPEATVETLNVIENVAGAPDDESPSGSVMPTRRARGYTRSEPITSISQLQVLMLML